MSTTPNDASIPPVAVTSSMAARGAFQKGSIHSGYQEVDFVEDADGIIAIISRRVAGAPLFTTGIFKVFERDGEACKTGFFDVVRQGDAVKRVVDEAKRKVTKLYAEAQAEWIKLNGGRDPRNDRRGHRHGGGR